MRFMISPAKKMKTDADTLEPKALPVFLGRAQELLEWLRQKDYGELKGIWSCSDAIALQNVERLKTMDLTRRLTPALLSYEGIQYQYMAPAVFEDGQWEYVEEHVRILSGFYGLLRPLDGVVPYRLEMQAKAGPEGDLYAFWNRSLYESLKKETDCIINLASREYAVCVEKYWKEEQGGGIAVPRYITCIFGEEKKDGRAVEKAGPAPKGPGALTSRIKEIPVVQKGTFAKMARGEMIRFAAEHGVEDPEGLKGFDRLGYRFRPEYSGEDVYVFSREEEAPV